MKLFGLKKNNTLDSHSEMVTINKSDLDLLLNAIADSNLEKELKVNLSSASPLVSILTSINQVITKQQEKTIKALLDINGRVERITSISSILDMMREIEKQTEYINNMAAQSEQMGAAASQMAVTTGNAASFANQSLDSARAGVTNLKDAILLIEHSFQEFEETNQQVLEVLDSMGEIEQMVGLIAGVADQTNLLALNAAIEAARAGEHGRGFAVVADEVRKLAEHTKGSVANINEKMATLNQSSSRTSERIIRVAQMMQQGKTKMQDTGDSIEQILSNIQSIAEDIHQIAAGNEEQSATLQEFGGHITELASGSGQTLNDARNAGEGIYQIGKELMDLRRRRIDLTPNLPIYEALDIYKTDHLCWIWRVYNMLLGFEVVDPNRVDTHETCRLGQWLNSPQGQQLKALPAYKKLDAPHHRVHKLAYESAIAYQKGDIAHVERILTEISTASREVIAVLTELQQGVQGKIS